MGLLGFLLDLIHYQAADPDVDRAVARAVEAIEPKLKYLPGYPRKFRKASRQALDYARQLAEQVPGPFVAEPAAFTASPYLRAFFATAGEVDEALVRSRAIHDLDRRLAKEGKHFYGLLGVRRREKTVLGIEMHGETLRRDVVQNVLSFADHTVTCTDETESLARDQLAWSFFDSLVSRVTQERKMWQGELAELDRILEEIQFRLRAATKDARDELLTDRNAVEADRAVLVKKLALSKVHKHVRRIVAKPSQYVRLETKIYRIDALGVVHSDEDVSASTPLEFRELIGRDRRIWTVALMRFTYPYNTDFSARLEQASRWLAI